MSEFIVIHFSYAQFFIMFLIVTCGSLFIILLCLMAGEYAIQKILTYLKTYPLLVDFIWHREKFKKWLEKENR